MDNTQRAKHLLKHGLTWLEIANELDVDLMTTFRATKRDKRLSCCICGGYFEQIKKTFRYCGFTCWAGSQKTNETWTQLKDRWSELST